MACFFVIGIYILTYLMNAWWDGVGGIRVLLFFKELFLLMAWLVDVYIFVSLLLLLRLRLPLALLPLFSRFFIPFVEHFFDDKNKRQRQRTTYNVFIRPQIHIKSIAHSFFASWNILEALKNNNKFCLLVAVCCLYVLDECCGL